MNAGIRMKRTGTSVGRMKDEADGDIRGKDEG